MLDIFYVRIYIKSTTVYVPSSDFGLSQPLSRQRICSAPPPRTGGGGTHSPVGEGLGEFYFRRLEKSLVLCLLCGINLKITGHRGTQRDQCDIESSMKYQLSRVLASCSKLIGEEVGCLYRLMCDSRCPNTLCTQLSKSVSSYTSHLLKKWTNTK